MSDSGSGIGTPIASPTFMTEVYDSFEELVSTPNCAVSLSRYAKLIGYDEAAFWGVIYENQPQPGGCGPLWSEFERFQIANALAEAQQEIEQVIGYPICPTYITGEYTDDSRWVDQQIFKHPRVVTRYPRIIEAGIKAVEVVGSASTIDYGVSDEYGVVGPVATNATSTDEIKVYYPNSDRLISPSRITISGGNVTIQIPRYRMVKQEFLSTPDGGIPYDNINFYLSIVDIKRIYTDPSTQAVLVRPHCQNNSCVGGCYECTRSACIYIRDAYIGHVDVTPATWDADTETWSTAVVCRGNYSIVRLNYLAGMRNISLNMEKAIIRLAHVKLGRPPCSCDKTRLVFQADYAIPDLLTRERINCPFGMQNGAFFAYRQALNMASKRASIF